MHVTQLLRSTAVAAVAAATLAQAALAGGEPKNELPFTRPVVTQPATVVIQSANGFSWTDGAIGLAAGVGVALSGAAVVGLTRRSPHTAN